MNTNMNKQLQDLMQKKMDRKDFLKHVAFGFVALTGATALIKALNPSADKAKQQEAANNSMAYGGSVYGGASKRQS